VVRVWQPIDTIGLAAASPPLVVAWSAIPFGDQSAHLFRQRKRKLVSRYAG
jgi:hypothetical protein